MAAEKPSYMTAGNILKFVLCSLFGAFAFFVPFSWHNRNTIFVDHVIKEISAAVPNVILFLTLAFILIGAVLPFVKGTWKRDTLTIVFTIFKVIGAIFAIMAYLYLVFGIKTAPDWMLAPDYLPYVYKTICGAVVIVTPVGSLFLTFLASYGLLEFIGVLFRPIMRPAYKVPGAGAINAVASFVGSFAVGIMLTNNLYKEGRFTEKESVIVMAGFSTTSASFMLYMCNLLNIMEYWNLVFWGALLVTFLVPVVICRIYPISKVPNTYYQGKANPFLEPKGDLLRNAFNEGVETASKAGNIFKRMATNFKDGLMMTFGFIPVIITLALIGLVLANMTPLFDWLAYIYYPFARLLNIQSPMLISKAVSTAGLDLMIPNILVAAAGESVSIASRFITAVTAIATVIGATSTIPCMLATDIKWKFSHILILWIERSILAMIFAALLAKIFLGF